MASENLTDAAEIDADNLSESGSTHTSERIKTLREYFKEDKATKTTT